MHKTLIIQAFNKAETLRKEQGEKIPSLIHIAEDLASFVEKIEGLGLNEKSYRIYRGDAKKLVDTSDDINIKQLKVINGLSKFLGYVNYEDYANSLNGKSFVKTLGAFIRKNKVILIILFFLLASLTAYYSINKLRWMAWDEDHYVETTFDVGRYNIGELKPYKEERIKYFKKIKPNCETEFFTVNNKVKLWYGKNKKKELEFFTALGLHPETGKTLDPITVYMIKKYICKEY